MKKSFWTDGLSINESRFSILISLLVIGSGFGFYQVVTDGDIANGLLTLLGYLIAAIAGVNITEAIANRGNKQNENMDNEI